MSVVTAVVTWFATTIITAGCRRCTAHRGGAARTADVPRPARTIAAAKRTGRVALVGAADVPRLARFVAAAKYTWFVAHTAAANRA